MTAISFGILVFLLPFVLCLVVFLHFHLISCGSSGSVVSDYGLDDRAIEVRSPTEAEDFPLAPASRPAMGPTQPPIQCVPGVLSPGVKRGRGVTLTTHPI
jgi:hypothetical protein